MQVGTEKRFDEGIAFAREFIREEMGEMLALKAWYCDSTHRYTMTDALQPVIEASERARRPEGDPKADLRRYYVLGHGSHLLDTARFLGGEIDAVRTRLVEKFGAYCWFSEVGFADGSVGHLDLTIKVRMDWHEGFQVYGEHGSVVGRTYNPWYYKSSDVECFSEKDGTYRRPLRRGRPLLQATGRGVRRRDTRRRPDARSERGGRARGGARDGRDGPLGTDRRGRETLRCRGWRLR